MVFEWLPIIFQTNAFEIRGLNANIRGLEPNNIKSKDEDNKNFNEPTHPIFVWFSVLAGIRINFTDSTHIL